MSDRISLKIFNRAIGTYTGWDDIEHMILVFYNFSPYHGFDMPEGDLTVDFEQGIFQVYNDDGGVLLEKDFMTVMNGFIAVENSKNQLSNV